LSLTKGIIHLPDDQERNCSYHEVVEVVDRDERYYSWEDRGVWRRTEGREVRCNGACGGTVEVASPSEDCRTWGCWRDPLLAKMLGLVSGLVFNLCS
jgi:hypothetical protein